MSNLDALGWQRIDDPLIGLVVGDLGGWRISLENRGRRPSSKSWRLRIRLEDLWYTRS